MPPKVTIKGQRPRRGKRLTRGTRWRIAAVSGRNRVFVGTLLKSFNFGSKRLAIFSVRKS